MSKGVKLMKKLWQSILSALVIAATLCALIPAGMSAAGSGTTTTTDPTLHYKGRVTNEERNAAAIRAKVARLQTVKGSGLSPQAAPQVVTPAAGGAPDYFGPYPNYANSP